MMPSPARLPAPRSPLQETPQITLRCTISVKLTSSVTGSCRRDRVPGAGGLTADLLAKMAGPSEGTDGVALARDAEIDELAHKLFFRNST